MPALAIALASKARNSPDLVNIIELKNLKKKKNRYSKSRNLIFKGKICIKIKSLIKRKDASD